MDEYCTLSDFPAETMINIFDNLKGNDLIKMTTVCKSWNLIIGNSQMNKISIKINDNSRRGLREVKELFEITDREYKHITIYFAKKINLESFETYGFNWKSVKLLRSTIASFDLLKEFLMKFEQTIEELDLVHLTLPSLFEKVKIELPKLKVLRCEHLRLEADILQMFESNLGNLKEFMVSYRSFSDVNFHIMDKATQIKTLRVAGTPITDVATNNLHSYLRMKKNDIKEIQIDSMGIPTLQLIWNELKSYKTLTFGSIALLIANSNFNLEENETLTRICLLFVMQYSLLDKIIQASPNLNYILVPTLQDETVNLVANKLTKIQQLYSYKSEPTNVRKVIKFQVYENTIDVFIEKPKEEPKDEELK
ncbi:unnamed protein product [Diamesa serratosioi]